jgi:hypothetical protein
VTGAPDLFGIGAVLNNAIQMGTGGGKCPELIAVGFTIWALFGGKSAAVPALMEFTLASGTFGGTR